MPRIAATVVADESKGDDSFLVDGERFPWYISEQGASALKVLDDLYEVRVVILPVRSDGNREDNSFAVSDVQEQPIISGIEFPWYITRAGVVYRDQILSNAAGTKDSPVCIDWGVELAFYAHSVEGVPVVGESAACDDGKFRAHSGRVIARAA